MVSPRLESSQNTKNVKIMPNQLASPSGCSA